MRVPPLGRPLGLGPPLLLALLCVWPPGAWAGDCKGKRQVLNGPPGYVTDGPGNYSVNGNCEWLIEAPSSRYGIVLSFTYMETECTYDYLFVYDGDSYDSPLLASLSGSTLPELIEAKSGKMLLHLFSDANYNLSGFNASFSFSLCPRDCSGHGVCSPDSGRCDCLPGWAGEGCSLPACGANCSLHGTCDQQSGRCRCDSGFLAQSCDLSLNDNQGAGSWYTVSSGDSTFSPRTAAAGVFINTTNALYVFGGFDLNQALGDLVTYNFTSNRWEERARGPAARHSHTAVQWAGTMVIFGGQLSDGSLAGDVWQYSPMADSWSQLSQSESPGAPRLANHASAVVDEHLYVFGGRSVEDLFSSELYRFSLLSPHWERVQPAGGKAPAAAGHSMVFYPPSRTLLVYGGHRPSTARFSVRVNTTDSFHVDQRYWTTFRSRYPTSGPRERAFHSATVIGDYMVVYGGNVHIHYHEEKCYDEEIIFYHLGCHQWSSADELTRMLLQSREGRESRRAGSGRYAHVAALTNENVLLVAGGYSGTPRGDLVAYKVPIFVQQILVQNHQLDYCSMYSEESSCSRNPECSWCGGGCRSYQRDSGCGSAGCLGLARFLSDCQSCLVFSGRSDSLPQAPGEFGWCVQNETCMPVTESSSCRVDQISRAYGWWGEKTRFITSLEDCQRDNRAPGIHLLTFQNPRNDSQPDKVSIVRSTSITLNPSTEMDVTLAFKGFIHPLWSSPGPGDVVSVWARVQRLYVAARIGKGPNTVEPSEELGRWAVQQDKMSLRLERSGGEQLFQNLERGNKYAVQIEGYLNNSGNGQTSELTLTWNRTGVPGGSEISFLFLEPFLSGSCSRYPSCLACLADQACGWCSQSSSCLPRVDPVHSSTTQCAGGEMQLILTPGNCVLCDEYRDCGSCSTDPYCEWQISGNKKGDFLCSRRGRVEGSIRNAESCPKQCNQRRSCGECLSNSSQCAWCQSAQSCFFFAAYLTKFPFGECRDWYDSVHSAPQCLDCSRHASCQDCLQNFECGWCGNQDNPTVGRCLHGGYSGLRDPAGFPNCSAAVSASHPSLPPWEPALWSYRSCPDVDECRLGLHACHPSASCHNTPDSYQCHCHRGYTGDGVQHCNRTCYNECVHGQCSGPPDYLCQCELGWTSNSSAVEQSGVECELDCGCNFHSTCETGLGVCDHCQDWTQGERCELCRPGSFGSAVERGGCSQCACNGHGVEELGFCEGSGGVCYCGDATEGQHCEKCVTGHYGDPRNNGTCYLECGGRVFLPNVTSMALGSARGLGVSERGLSYCLWVLSASSHLQPCSGESQCPSMSLTIQPDINTNCTSNYVYVFDGLPEFLSDGVLRSDRNLIGAFCGTGWKEPITVAAASGNLATQINSFIEKTTTKEFPDHAVYFEVNMTDSPWPLSPVGFNASLRVRRCAPPGCPPAQRCREGGCVCVSGFAGPDCSLEVCPGECGESQGRGACNTSLGGCVCSEGFAGSDCSLPVNSSKMVWETLIDPQRTTNQAHRFLQRFAHSLVEGPDSTLWLFGGLSLREGILGNVYRYSISDRRWTQMLTSTADGGPGPAPRYFHAAAFVANQNAMFVTGGLTQGGVASDMWSLNLVTLQWRQENSLLLPPVAGHTLTVLRGRSLLLIGGYSPEHGFNNKLLEFNLETGNWTVGLQTGTPPTGLYGHSAVYHEGTDALFLFGGYRFHVGSVAPSAELYSLFHPNLTWSLLSPSQGKKPLSRFLHVAALFRDTMVIVGGRTEQEEFSNTVLLYQINCNTWVQPSQPESWQGMPLDPSVSPAMAVAGGRLFLCGGFNGVALGRMLTLTLPSDPCLVLATASSCNQSSGSCVWCRESCVSADTADRLGCSTGQSQCLPAPRSPDECRRLRTCSECLARHPKTTSLPSTQLVQQCKWCTNCPEGACIGREGSCTLENDCRINQREIFTAGNCSEINCEASDCPKCTASGKCMWTRQFKRTGETRRILSVTPSHDWTCFSHSLLNMSPMPVESSPPRPCPTPCHQHSSCRECLGSKGADGGWRRCLWSLSLSQCVSPSYLPLLCVAGRCGRVLNGSESCSPECSRLQQCSSCIRQPSCGWCAARGLNGAGQCLQGGLGGAQQGESGGTCTESNGTWAFLSCPPENECLNGHHDCNATQNCNDKLQGYECPCKSGYTLHNVTGQCKPVCAQGCVNGTCVEPNRCQCHFGYVGENCSVECHCNKHSNCANVTAQDSCLQCFNNTMGDYCEKCRPLFVGSAVKGGACKPCREHCRGNSDICITHEENKRAAREPDKYPLEPDLIPSWVGEGPREDNVICVNCQNSSSGEKCESCLPGYFLLEGKCSKCKCNGHADTCEVDGTGCPCQNNTETLPCLSQQSDGSKRNCYELQCAKCKDSFNGSPVDGRQCYRQFNVEQEFCFDPTSQSNCYHEPNLKSLPRGRTVFFAAQPKFTNVDIRVTIDVTFGGVELYVSNSPDTFVVDVDKKTGVHSVHISTSTEPSPIRGGGGGGGGASTPARDANASSISGQPLQQPSSLARVRELRASGLITYITVDSQNTVLVVRGVTDRVVITYPHEVHTLKSSRFYIALLGTGGAAGSGESQGVLFLRQDQAHIDLFVFFSVFFSCFFLFLSVCVLLWKVKQFLDFRQEQQRHLQEMTKMASRPFAKLSVYLEPEQQQQRPPSSSSSSSSSSSHLLLLQQQGGGGSAGGHLVYLPARAQGGKGGLGGGGGGGIGGNKGKPSSYQKQEALRQYHHNHHHSNPHSSSYQQFCRSDPFLSQLMGFSYPSFKVGPITLEPTDDGMAGVATVLLQLPGGALAPNRACLGSALVTLRHNLQEYCGATSSHGATHARKRLLSHENLTTMSM
ncbi:multiple epidermal growth factor-like domains protein 8 [Polyodon spathula]|uniref:multiple epidermal growth factor-like domains protein 8 n=1 Tax=Polyodon spathula TaxID=7913 RepID=UPI001B7EE34C|nr:multiple epidermal growth factor-like domains protein 8 [Polyodon spathula]